LAKPRSLLYRWDMDRFYRFTSKFYLIALFSLLFCAQGRAADEFDTIKCGANVPKAMVGKNSSNERVVILEARHSNLGLKDLGGSEISDRLFVVSWLICGTEYEELVDTGKHWVQDVLPMPTHSLHSPQSFLEGCQVAGKEIPDDVIAILDNKQGQKPKAYLEEIMLPATLAWKIDERLERFVPIPTEGLSCALSGGSPDLKQ
jgi:hypothetical protein